MLANIVIKFEGVYIVLFKEYLKIECNHAQ